MVTRSLPWVGQLKEVVLARLTLAAPSGAGSRVSAALGRLAGVCLDQHLNRAELLLNTLLYILL